MATRPCPRCPATALRHLPSPSEGAYVDYYRCDACGHVFNVPKAETDTMPRQISRES